jgi:hypothetical protein
MNPIRRLASLALALGVTLAMVATTSAPAHAQAVSVGRASQSQAAGALTADAHDRSVVATRTTQHSSHSTGSPHAGDHVKPFGPHVNYMGHDYCGSWLHGPAWCLTFNKVEAGYISAVSLATATAFICGATALVTCAVAVGLAAAIQRYVDRNGVCPNSHPKMRVEYFPSPGRVSCD